MRELMVTVYDVSTCNVPYGSYGFDITTCTTIDANLYNEIQSAGRPSINLYSGQYFLTVEGANYEDVAVNIYFELVGYVANGGSMLRGKYHYYHHQLLLKRKRSQRTEMD